MLSSVQLLREGNPGRKIAEIQGKLATVPHTACHAQERGQPLWRVPGAVHRCPLGGRPMSPTLDVPSRGTCWSPECGGIGRRGERRGPEHWLGPT